MRARQEASSSVACVALLAMLAITSEFLPRASGLHSKAMGSSKSKIDSSKSMIDSSQYVPMSGPKPSLRLQTSMSLLSPAAQLSPMPFSSTGLFGSSTQSGRTVSSSSVSSLFGRHSDLFNLVGSHYQMNTVHSSFTPDSFESTYNKSEPASPRSSYELSEEAESMAPKFALNVVFPEAKVLNDFKTASFRRVKTFNEDRYLIRSGPVVVAPGYGGSRLEARLTKSDRPRHSCGRKYSWFGVWINLGLLFNMDCMIYAMKLNLDPMTNATHDSPGIEVRVQKDKIDKVEVLHSLPMTEFAYFGPIIKKLAGSLGYTREINIRGAPYDFRKAPNELYDYYKDLRETIEHLYISNGYKRVSLICHSMGCPVMLYFLQRMPQIWKDFYIQRLISLGAPWAGSMGAVRAAFFGDNLGMPLILEEIKMNILQRSLPATMFLFPKEYAYKDRPLIKTNMDPIMRITSAPPRNHTLDDMEHLFKALDHMDGYKMYMNTKDLLGDFDPPNVEVWCLVGKGFETLSEYHFSADFPHSPRDEIYEDGDRTVSLESAAYCRTWKSKQTQPVHYKEFAAVDHMGILRDSEVLSYIEKILDVDLVNEITETN